MSAILVRATVVGVHWKVPCSGGYLCECSYLLRANWYRQMSSRNKEEEVRRLSATELSMEAEVGHNSSNQGSAIRQLMLCT